MARGSAAYVSESAAPRARLRGRDEVAQFPQRHRDHREVRRRRAAHLLDHLERPVARRAVRGLPGGEPRLGRQRHPEPRAARRSSARAATRRRRRATRPAPVPASDLRRAAPRSAATASRARAGRRARSTPRRRRQRPDPSPPRSRRCRVHRKGRRAWPPGARAVRAPATPRAPSRVAAPRRARRRAAVRRHVPRERPRPVRSGRSSHVVGQPRAAQEPERAAGREAAGVDQHRGLHVVRHLHVERLDVAPHRRQREHLAREHVRAHHLGGAAPLSRIVPRDEVAASRPRSTDSIRLVRVSSDELASETMDTEGVAEALHQARGEIREQRAFEVVLADRMSPARSRATCILA